MEHPTTPELKDMTLQIERVHMEPCIMKDKRSTPRFHTIKNFWNIMDDKDSKVFREKKKIQIQRIRNQNYI